ncbi:MAG: hypothetical protein KAT43_04965 [Nanoarchaeota archaeon]|nr:hypothetical protein [Nanoarchaeota archaeon]
MKRILIFALIVFLLVSATACKKELTAEEKYEKESAQIITGIQKAFDTELTIEAEGKDYKILKKYYIELHKIIESFLEDVTTMEVPAELQGTHAYLREGVKILMDYYPAKLAHTEMLIVAEQNQKGAEKAFERGQITSDEYDEFIQNMIDKQNERLAVMKDIQDKAIARFDMFLQRFKNSNQN